MTDNILPHVNLAAEEFLTTHAKEGEVSLMLWQNAPCVVIGKNQNPWRECNVERMKADGVTLVRRISGGGAVYHDVGNLNFTFIARDDLYDVARQTEVILQAVRLLGIDARKTGRNDLTIDERKFSGHAYYSHGGYNYHHGTIMIDVVADDLQKYLNVSADKLKSKGVSSVRSRVVNLKEHLPDITVEAVKTAMIMAFEMVYGGEAVEGRFPVVTAYPDMTPLVIKYQSDEWTYGTKIPFETSLEKRFDWGSCEVQLAMKGGHISECKIYSDCLDTELLPIVEASLIGTNYDAKTILSLKDSLPSSNIVEDVIELIASSIN